MNLKLSDNASGRVCLIAAAVLWGLAGVCVKSITWNSMPLVTVRSVLSFIVLAICRRSFKIRFSWVNFFGALMQSATGILYIQSIKLTTAGTAIVLQYVAPILVFLFTVIFRHRKARLSEYIITLCVFGGIVLSFADSLDPTRIVGNLLGLASGFTFAAQMILMSAKNADSGDALMIGCILSFAFTFPFVFGDTSMSFDVTNIVWILILGIFQYGLANVLFGKGVRKVDTVEASLLLTIEPIFNPIPVAIFCGENMGPLALVGFFVVILFVTLYACLPALRTRFPESKLL